MAGSPSSFLGALSSIGFAFGGQGSVPTGQLAVGYGTFVANQTSAVTVADPNVTASSVFMFGIGTIGGTPSAAPYIATQTPGTGFTIKAGSGDTTTYTYVRVG